MGFLPSPVKSVRRAGKKYPAPDLTSDAGLWFAVTPVERVTSFLAALLLIHDALLFFLHFLQTLHEV